VLNSGTALSLLAAPSSYTLVAKGQNQKNLAKALDHWIGKESGDVGLVTLGLDLLRANQYPAAFNAIGPAYYSALPSVGIEQSIAHVQLLGQRMTALRAGAGGISVNGVTQESAPVNNSGKDSKDSKQATFHSPDGNRWGYFLQLTGQFADVEPLQNLAAESHFNTAGVLTGVDYRIGKESAIGIGIGYDYTRLSFTSGDHTTMDDGRIAAYGTFSLGRGFFMEATAGGVYTNYDVKRPIQYGVINRSANSEPEGGQFFSSVELGKDIKLGNWTITPKTGFQYSYLSVSGADESQAGVLGLAVDRFHAESMRYNLGAQVAYDMHLTDKIELSPYLFGSWQHDFASQNVTIRSVLPQGGGPFDFNSSGLGRNSAVMGAGLRVQKGKFSLNLGYQADFGSDSYSSTLIFSEIGYKF